MPLPFGPLYETMTFRPIGKPVLAESVANPGRQVLRQSGVFQNWKVRNSNKRTYPKSIWENLFKEGSEFMARLRNRSMVGLLEHPDDGVTKLDRIPSHLIVDVHFASEQEIRESQASDHPLEEGDIVGTFEVLDTSTGKDLRALIEAGVLIGVSSRGGGSLREDGDGYIVEEDFECETWDVVATPSVTRATPRITTRTTEAAPPKANTVTEAAPVPSPAPVNPPPSPTPTPTPVPAAAAPAPAAPSTPNPTITESTTKPHMKTIRDIQLELTQLRATPRKGLKPSERASLIEATLQMQVNVAKALAEDATQAPLAARLNKQLNEFMDELDQPEVVDAAPAGDGDGGKNDGDDAKCEVIQQAADKLRELGSGDEAVEELAGQLEELADDCTPINDESAPADGEPVAETIKRLRKRLAVETAKRTRCESTLSKLSAASSKLVERHKALTTRVKQLEESGNNDEAMTAARELAARYNRDMIEFGSLQLKRTRPALAEAHAERLKACKTWESYSKLVETLIAAETKKGKVTEAAPAKPGKVTEAAPAPKPGKPAAPNLAESVVNHPALRMAVRHRPAATPAAV